MSEYRQLNGYCFIPSLGVVSNAKGHYQDRHGVLPDYCVPIFVVAAQERSDRPLNDDTEQSDSAPFVPTLTDSERAEIRRQSAKAKRDVWPDTAPNGEHE